MPVSRRSFLLGSASAVVLAACGGSDDKKEVASTTTTAGGLAVVKIFDPVQPGGTTLRLPMTLADSEGAIKDSVPESIKVRYGLEGTSAMSAPLDVQRRSEGIPRPYYPLVATFPETGTYRIEVEADGEKAATTLEIVEPNRTAVVPSIGEALISLKTPTVDDSRGVDPICTRDPMCPFHSQTLEEAMTDGNAVALLISTPAFCQTAVCGPVLDLLVDRQEQFEQVLTIVHAEVYTDDTAKTTTDTVQAYGLTFEPALFLAIPDGTIAARLDYVFDASELDEALSNVVQ
jgi:hypothetical protein